MSNLSQAQRRRVRGLVLVIGVGLVLELGMAWKGREPYPAVLMPGFARAQSLGDSYTYVTPVITAGFGDASTQAVSPLDLFGANSFHFAKRSLDRLFFVPTGSSRPAPAVEEAVVHWMKNNLQVRLGRDDLESVRIEWIEHSVSTESLEISSRTVVGWRKVDF